MLSLTLALSGCAAQNSINITRQTSLSPAVKLAPFMVLLTQDEGTDTSYQGYSQAVVARLQAQGLASVNDPAKAHYAVMLERSWPHQHPKSDPSSESADAGGGGHGHGGGGFGGGGGGHHHGGGGGPDRTEADSKDTSLKIVVFDLTRPNTPQERVFFASAKAPIGQDENDAAVATMIDAALKDFPGKPRESYAVALPK